MAGDETSGYILPLLNTTMLMLQLVSITEGVMIIIPLSDCPHHPLPPEHLFNPPPTIYMY